MIWQICYFQHQLHWRPAPPLLSNHLQHRWTFCPLQTSTHTSASWQKAEKHSLKVWKTGASITSTLSVKSAIAAKYRNTTPHLIINTYSQSGTNDYVVSYLLFKILHHNVTGCSPTETGFLTQKNRKRVQRTKGVCLQRVETGNEGVECGSQKKTGLKSSRLWGGTGVCVSSLSNQANPGEKTILD